jgi:hypothetical protein
MAPTPLDSKSRTERPDSSVCTEPKMSTNKSTSSSFSGIKSLWTWSLTALSIRKAPSNQHLVDELINHVKVRQPLQIRLHSHGDYPQRISFDCFVDQKIRVVERMMKGGNGSQKLAAFMLAADHTNLEALIDSKVIFENLISEYLDGGIFDK